MNLFFTTEWLVDKYKEKELLKTSVQLNIQRSGVKEAVRDPKA